MPDECCLTIATSIARTRLRTHARRSPNGRTETRTWAGLDSRVGAEHANTRAKLGSTERNHVLANMASNKLAVLRV